MTYEIQHNTWVDGWVNTSTTEDTDGNEIPLVFATQTDAQTELDDYMGEIDSQIASGEREAHLGYDPDDFRIREAK